MSDKVNANTIVSITVAIILSLLAYAVSYGKIDQRINGCEKKITQEYLKNDQMYSRMDENFKDINLKIDVTNEKINRTNAQLHEVIGYLKPRE